MILWVAKTIIYSKGQINLSFAITLREDAHDFCKECPAFTRSKNRRSQRQKTKSFVVDYNSFIKEKKGMLLEAAGWRPKSIPFLCAPSVLYR